MLAPFVHSQSPPHGEWARGVSPRAPLRTVLEPLSSHGSRHGTTPHSHRGGGLSAIDDARRIADLERKIGQLTMENDFLKKALQHFRDHHPPAVVSGADACLKKLRKARRKAKP